MKIVKLFSLVAVSFAVASFSAACGWFQDDSEEQISRFYQPDDGIASRDARNGGKGSGLDNGTDSPFAQNNLGEGEGAGEWGTDPAGGNGAGDGELYADFGTRISGVEFEPVYFLFDQNMILKTQEDKLLKVADYLKSNAAAGVVIEGNCDERGTTEYNRALGEKRAIAAKTFLMDQGIAESRIKTVSYGEERPAQTGTGEDIFRLNRRDEFIPVTMKK